MGFEGPFGGGRHGYIRHPETRVKISVPGGRDIPIKTMSAIIREAGMSVEEWLAV